jgi:hypothetical protein
MPWVILVNRKLVSIEVYGPFDDEYIASQIERQFAHETRAKTIELARVHELRTDDAGHLIRTGLL